MTATSGAPWRVTPRVWPSPPGRLHDPGCDVHVFRADLDDPRRNVDLYRLMLADAELRRVDDVGHAHTRRRLSIAFGLARITHAAHVLAPGEAPLDVVSARLGSVAVFAASRGPRVGMALVPAATGTRGVAHAALEAIGHAKGRATDPDAVDTAGVGQTLARGRAALLRVDIGGSSWNVQVLGLAPDVCLVVAGAGPLRTLRCWALGA